MKRHLFPLYIRTERMKLWFRSRFTPLGRLVTGVAALAFLFGINVQQTMIYQIFSLCLLVLAFSFISSLRFRPQLEFERRLPETAIAGKKLSYQVSLKNLRENALQGVYYREVQKRYLPTWEEFSSSREDGEERRNGFDRAMGYYRFLWLLRQANSLVCQPHPFQRVGGRKTTSQEQSLIPMRRGNIHLTGAAISRIDPLGLCQKEYLYRKPANLLVLPKLYPMDPLSFTGSRRYHQGGLSAAQTRGDSNEYLSLREYVYGDPVKYIDWKSTARSGRAIVKQYRDEYFSRYGCILDSFTTNPESQVFEEAVSVAASILMGHDSVKSVLDLLFVGDECIRCSVGPGLSERQEMMKMLASVSTCSDKSFDELARLVKAHASLMSGAIVILIDIDQQRLELINFLIASRIPCKSLLLTAEPEAMAENDLVAGLKHHLHIVDINKMEEQLLAL